MSIAAEMEKIQKDQQIRDLIMANTGFANAIRSAIEDIENGEIDQALDNLKSVVGYDN